MMDLGRIDIRFIIRDHLLHVKDSLWLLIGLPLIFSVVMTWKCFYMSEPVVNISITSLSIFIALFFNVSILLLDLKRRVGDNPYRIETLQETHDGISFMIVVGLLSIVASYGTLLDQIWIKKASNFFAYFLIGVFFLTVALTIKNVHILFNDDLGRSA